MIRKILLFIALVYITLWFAVAYVLKGNVVALIKHSETDNIKITYKEIKVSGFPARWHIKLVEPKIQFINGINFGEFSSSAVTFAVHFSLKKILLDFGPEIKQQEVSQVKSEEYIARSGENIQILIKLNKPLYKLSNTDNFQSIAKLLQFNNKLLSIVYQGKELYNISALTLLLNKRLNADNENIALQLHLLYTGQEKVLNFTKAELDIATILDIATKQKNQEAAVKILNFDHFKLVCDENAHLEMRGGLQFFQHRLPQGKLSFELINYHDVVDKLISDNLIFPKKMVKTLIEKAVHSTASEVVKTDDGEISTYEKIKFDVDFSDTGVNIGSVNLLEFNLQNNKELNN